jgi:hypothetical protein
MRINIILAILAAVLVVPCWITISDDVEDFVDPNAVQLLFPGFSRELVSVIEIKRRKSQDVITAQNIPPEQQFESIVFQREGEGWSLLNDLNFSGLAIAPRLVDGDLLEHIASLTLDQDALVPAENVTDEFRKEQQLTEATGIIIRCLRGPQGPELATLILGKSTTGGGADLKDVDGYYVCRPDRPREVVIYEPKDRTWRVSLRPSDWADKKIHEFLLSEVESFYFLNALGSAGFKRKKGSADQWVPIADKCMQGSQKLDLSTLGEVIHKGERSVTELVNRFTSMTADEFKREKIAQDVNGNEVEVRATLKDGTEYVLRAGMETDMRASCLAISSNHRFQFYIADIYVGTFRRQDPKDLFRTK